MIDEPMSPPADRPVEEMSRKALCKEAYLLGGIGIRSMTPEQLRAKVLELRKIRDELDAEEHEEGVRLIGWLPPLNPGQPWRPVIEKREKT